MPDLIVLKMFWEFSGDPVVIFLSKFPDLLKIHTYYLLFYLIYTFSSTEVTYCYLISIFQDSWKQQFNICTGFNRPYRGDTSVSYCWRVSSLTPSRFEWSV